MSPKPTDGRFFTLVVLVVALAVPIGLGVIGWAAILKAQASHKKPGPAKVVKP